MSQPFGAAISGSGPESGQSHRSGPNFQFLSTVPDSGNLTVTITGTPNPDDVSANLKKDEAFSDSTIGSLSNGGTIEAKKVNSEDNFYIADPDKASEDFVVYFSA